MEKFKNKNTKRKGLVLYEMIVSVFIISVCSVFILQIFLYSKTLSAKANDIDNSSIILLNALELSKNYPSLNKYLKDDFFQGATIESYDANKSSKIVIYYDENWDTINTNGKPISYFKNCKYVLVLNIDKIESSSRQAILLFKQDALFATTYGNSSGLKYNIDGTIYYIDNGDILINLDTTSYFSNNIK